MEGSVLVDAFYNNTCPSYLSVHEESILSEHLTCRVALTKFIKQ